LGSSTRHIPTTACSEKNADWGDVKRLGIDEISQRKGHQDFVSVVSDLDRGILLEVINSHKQNEIIAVLQQQPLALRESVQEVSVDMWGGFGKVIEQVFPNAVVVFDRFHVMKAVNSELNKVRNQVGIKIKNSKYILLKNGVDLSEAQRETLRLILQQSNRLRKAYALKEESREIYESRISVEDGREKFNLWIDKAKTVYCDAITTIRNHLDGICNYFISRTTSGVMEGINNKCKLIKRQAYGFVNFDNFRMRLLSSFSD
jgi:transposase